jgi:hypothetical protein
MPKTSPKLTFCLSTPPPNNIKCQASPWKKIATNIDKANNIRDVKEIILKVSMTLSMPRL